MLQTVNKTQKAQTDTGNTKSDKAEIKAKAAKPGAEPILQKLQTECLSQTEEITRNLRPQIVNHTDLS